MDGYSKLHRKVLKLAAPGSLIAFSSCTHYVSHDEFQKNILDAAYKENKAVIGDNPNVIGVGMELNIGCN